MKRSLLSAAFAATLPTLATAQVYYATDDAGGADNHRLSTASGTSTSGLFTGSEAWGLADDDANGVLYMNDGATLNSIDYAAAGGAVTNLGGLTYMGGARVLTSLSFSGGVLYGNPNIAVEGFYQIDVVTLDTTLVYTFQNSSIDIGGLDEDPATGLLYGSNDGSNYSDPQGNSGRGILLFDVGAGTEAIIAPYPMGETDIDGLAFDPAGIVYMLEDEPAPLHNYDLATMSYDPMPPMNAIPASEVFSSGTYTRAAFGEVGTNHCGPAVPNSTGASATILAFGSTAVADNDLTLQCQHMPQNAFGFVLASETQGMSMPASSMGVLCLAGDIGRGVGGVIANTGATGTFSVVADLNAMPQPMGAVVVTAGETWNFQGWFRDAVGGVATSNLTDAVSVTFN